MVSKERFAQGMTFDEYVKFVGTPDNLKREGSFGMPRRDYGEFLRKAFESAQLSDAQREAWQWIVSQPNGPAKMLVISHPTHRVALRKRHVRQLKDAATIGQPCLNGGDELGISRIGLAQIAVEGHIVGTRLIPDSGCQDQSPQRCLWPRGSTEPAVPAGEPVND